jgi:hypothetical protein
MERYVLLNCKRFPARPIITAGNRFPLWQLPFLVHNVLVAARTVSAVGPSMNLNQFLPIFAILPSPCFRDRFSLRLYDSKELARPGNDGTVAGLPTW